jgi:hypothetical protein
VKLFTFAAVGVVLVAGCASATPITITNPSFELNIVSPVSCSGLATGCQYTPFGTAVSGWTGTAGSLLNPGTSLPNVIYSAASSVPNGQWVTALGTDVAQSLSQNLGTLAPNTYALSFYVGVRSDASTRAPGAREFNVRVSSGATNFVNVTDPVVYTAGNFVLYSTLFNILPTDPNTNVTLSFNLAQGVDSGRQVQIDQVVMDSVPEPATFAIVGAGLIGLAVLRRRQRA